MDDAHSPAVLHRYGPGDIPALLDTLVEIWADAHADHPDVAEASLSPEGLRQQLTTHTRHEGFALVLAFAAVDAAPIHADWSALLDDRHLTVHAPGAVEPWFEGELLLTRDWCRAARVHRGVLLITGPFSDITEFPDARVHPHPARRRRACGLRRPDRRDHMVTPALPRGAELGDPPHGVPGGLDGGDEQDRHHRVHPGRGRSHADATLKKMVAAVNSHARWRSIAIGIRIHVSSRPRARNTVMPASTPTGSA